MTLSRCSPYLIGPNLYAQMVCLQSVERVLFVYHVLCMFSVIDINILMVFIIFLLSL